MADGGEGTLAALAVALGDAAERRSVEATDALGRPVTADWLLTDGNAAFVEMAAASGLARLEVGERTPDAARRASTRGTGAVLRAALDAGVERITIGLGGSATTDGGSGLLRELGLLLLDREGSELADGGAALAQIGPASSSASMDPRLATTQITIASDVTNPLCGSRGAAATYGPQKGADEATVAELDAALAQWGAFIERATGKLVADLPGAGAAGGTTAGLLGFTRATVRPGVEVVAELVGLREALEDADLVITGEGRADAQTLHGKAAIGVATLARSREAPVVLLCGGLGDGAEALDAATALSLVQPIVDRPLPLADAMADTERLLVAAAGRLARTVGIGLELSRR
jgi:glycerate kinase